MINRTGIDLVGKKCAKKTLKSLLRPPSVSVFFQFYLVLISFGP